MHGGGGTAFEEWVRLWVGRGYAAIALDTCGQVPVGNYGQWVHDEHRGALRAGGAFDQIDEPQGNQWTYHAVADAILAHSLLRSLPEVDSERTGVNWHLLGWISDLHPGRGGFPVLNWLFPFMDVVIIGILFSEGNLSKMKPEQADRWMQWWDPSVYLRAAGMPILWVTGSNDFAYSMDALQLSYLLPKGSRTSLHAPENASWTWGGPEKIPRKFVFFADAILKGGKPLPAIVSQDSDDQNVWATYSNSVPIVKAELNFTKDTGRWQDRKWESIPANQTSGKSDCGFTRRNPRVLFQSIR